MNEYEAKIEARKERMLKRAELCKKLSDLRYERARSMASIIPLGQPILIGHHSETRDRNYRGKIQRNYEKAAELARKAEYYTGKAFGVGTGGISSDDPEAIVKLQEQIAQAEAVQSRMVAANKLIRKDDRAGLAEIGFTEGQITGLFEKDFCGRIGFADYQLQNNNANIRRMKQRIDGLRAEYARRPADPEQEKVEEINGVRVRENIEVNRLQMIFPGKPSADVRTKLKSRGFHWSPRENAWQRQLNNAARYAAQEILKSLDSK